MAIDIAFDFRTDAHGKKPDPDASSPTLLRYHSLLWSKALPSGGDFHLTPQWRRPYSLLYDSVLGRFVLTSDSVLPTFTRRADMQPILESVSSIDLAAFDRVTYTIGGMMLWPGERIDGKWTINQARGCVRRIADRFDLTLECVRRHYAGDRAHPLAGVFDRYRTFFELFGDFAGYIKFWLLDDLVDAEGSVRLFLPSENFTLPAVPQTAADYVAFCERTLQFVDARNERIQRFARDRWPTVAL